MAGLDVPERGRREIVRLADGECRNRPRFPTAIPLQGEARSPGGSPRPLEIESAEVAGDVDRLADEVQALYRRGFHRLRREAPGIDAAERHFRLVVPERA